MTLEDAILEAIKSGCSVNFGCGYSGGVEVRVSMIRDQSLHHCANHFDPSELRYTIGGGVVLANAVRTMARKLTDGGEP